jgi:hypothetical protein
MSSKRIEIFKKASNSLKISLKKYLKIYAALPQWPVHRCLWVSKQMQKKILPKNTNKMQRCKHKIFFSFNMENNNKKAAIFNTLSVGLED